ncbi:hypothetical protein ACJMK2_013019 [Sinanodonta woodiana]|uniref:G-protein coupled receptors family 1 profile domain-containing protein n=1 Tax=Sinanodonta woodiana TaxID=1069815 RepID=A0ABD3VCB9_SINWO
MDTNVNMSEGDNQDFQLEQLEKEKVLQNIGGIIFVSLLMILGIGGNSVAIFVYLRKYKQSLYRTFIVSLAIVDLATCCVPMMFIILKLRYPIHLFGSWACKMLAFLIYSMCIGSSMILVTIAGERYRKICVPHGMQFSARMSKYICIIDGLLGMVLAWPAAVLYGNKSVTNGQNKIVGTECDVSDDFADTNYPVYFNIFLLCIVLATFIVLSSIYAFIGKQIFRMKKIISRKPPKTIAQDDLVRFEFTTSHCSLREEDSTGEIVQTICDSRSYISTISSKANEQETRSFRSKGKHHVFKDGDISQKENESKRKKTVAVTRVFFIITVVYFCSFLPHFALRIAAFLNKEFIPSLSFAGTVAYQMFRWTFFINNMANPIIYTVYDRKFIGEVRLLCTYCLGVCLNVQPKTR